MKLALTPSSSAGSIISVFGLLVSTGMLFFGDGSRVRWWTNSVRGRPHAVKERAAGPPLAVERRDEKAFRGSVRPRRGSAGRLRGSVRPPLAPRRRIVAELLAGAMVEAQLR